MSQDYNYEGEIHPELAQSSGIVRELVDASDQLMSLGIDLPTALVIVAAVPTSLGLLRIINRATGAWTDDWLEERRLARKRKEMELEREFGQGG